MLNQISNNVINYIKSHCSPDKLHIIANLPNAFIVKFCNDRVNYSLTMDINDNIISNINKIIIVNDIILIFDSNDTLLYHNNTNSIYLFDICI